MNKCNSCNVLIENSIEKCPLCNGKTEQISSDYACGYPKVKETFLSDLISQLMLFLMLTGSIACFIINIYVRTGFAWSLIAIAGQLYLYFSIKTIVRKNKNIPVLILAQIVLVAFITLIIDFSVGFSGWSINYVIPFSIVAGSIILSILSFLNTKKYREYIFYIFIIAIIGMIPILALVFKIVTVFWPCVLCVMYSVLTIVFMIMFSARRFKTELEKRLHF